MQISKIWPEFVENIKHELARIQKKLCSARRGPGSKRTSNWQLPARNTGSEMKTTISAA
ncbi:hypothetical protein ABIB88_002607 [Bradyrhizobium sp. JR19.8]